MCDLVGGEGSDKDGVANMECNYYVLVTTVGQGVEAPSVIR